MSDGDTTFFFMHVMKTGGTSFSQHVAASFAPHEVFPPKSGPRRAEQYWKVEEVARLTAEERAPVRVFSGHYPFVVADMVGADVTMTILREPVDRVISHLRHCRRHFDRHRGKPLEEIYDDPWHHPHLFRDYQVKQLAFTAADAPKGHIDVLDVDEVRFAEAARNLQRLTVLGLTDDLGSMRAEVADRFGWDVHHDARLQTSPGPARVPAALRRRIEADSAADVAFYDLARSRHEAGVRAHRRATHWLGRRGRRR